MDAQRFATIDGNTVSVPADRLSAFADAVRGDLLTPSDPSYNEARAVWNGMIDRHPAFIARCSGEADVADVLARPGSTGCASPSGRWATTSRGARSATTGWCWTWGP